MDKEINLSHFKIENPYDTVEFELVQLSANENIEDEIDRLLAENQDRLQNLDAEIDRLTNNSDKFDNLISIASGVLCGLIDILFVGEMKLDSLTSDQNGKGADWIKTLVKKVATQKGHKGDSMSGAISKLEKEFPIPSDCYKELGISSSHLHHLEDLCHHPSPIGFLASVISTLFRIGIFAPQKKDEKGNIIGSETKLIKLPFGEGEKKDIITYWCLIGIAGFLYWLSCALCRKWTGRELSEQPKPIRLLVKAVSSAPFITVLTKIAYQWAGHLISDINGSHSTPDGGKGIPGLFISLLKELSMVPPFCNSTLPEEITKLYSVHNVDARQELSQVVGILGKQAIPVILNELIVSGFYLIRHLTTQIKEKGNWKDVEWSKVIPYGNRTIARMRTISSGVFTAMDVLSATLEEIIKNGGNVMAALPRIALKINIVGVGRFTLALGNDIGMGLRRGKMSRIRQKVMTERLYLLNAKLYIRVNEAWKELADTDNAISELQELSTKAISTHKDVWIDTFEDFDFIKRKIRRENQQNSPIENLPNIDDLLNIYL